LGFGLGISFFTGIVFGLVPALQSSKVDLNESLKEGSRGVTSGTRQNRIRNALVVSEVSLAVVLLIGATLLTRSFIRLLDTNPGFDASNVLKLEVNLPNVPPSRYANESEQVGFFQQLIDRVGTVPGVESAAGVVTLPLTGAFESTDIIIEGREPAEGGTRPEADYNTITPDYFKVLRIPLQKGRQFTAQDVKDAPRVIIVNDVLAQRLWPNEEVLGKRLRVGFETESREIVCVVATTKQANLIAEMRPTMYMPYAQFPIGGLTLMIRTKGDPLSLVPVVREHVRLQDRDIPVSRIGTMEQVLSASVAQQRFTMLLMGLFAVLALILALVGIYAVMSYLVTQRSHEIGIRLALGAKMNDVLQLMLKTGLSLTLAGIAIGLAAAWALTRFMSSLLFGVTSTDVWTFIGVPMLLGIVAMIACYIPARRATKVDPLVGRRYEKNHCRLPIADCLAELIAKNKGRSAIGNTSSVSPLLFAIGNRQSAIERAYMNTFLQDLRYGMRMLFKNPGVSAVAIVTLALGIGANAAIFSVVNTVLLRPLPYKDPDRLVAIWENVPTHGQWRVSPANFFDWKKQSASFEGMSAYGGSALTLTGAGEPVQLQGTRVSSGYFEVVGVQPLIGRPFLAEEYEVGKEQVVILGHALWRQRFGSDNSILNKTITLDDQPYTVVGVMPPGLYPARPTTSGHISFDEQAQEYWTPMSFTAQWASVRSAHVLGVVGRLKNGVTLEQAVAEMKTISARLEQEHAANKGEGIIVNPFMNEMVGDVRPALVILFLAVGLVLLIACANIAGLLLPQHSARSKEIAIRAALGAGRRRLVKQFFIEGMLLAGVGAIAGLAVAAIGMKTLIKFIPQDIPRLAEAGLDWRVLSFT